MRAGLYPKAFEAFKSAFLLVNDPKCAQQLTELRRAKTMHRFGNICRILGAKKQAQGKDDEAKAFLKKALLLLKKTNEMYKRQPNKDLALLAATYSDMAAVLREQANAPSVIPKAPVAPGDVEKDGELQCLKFAVKLESTLHGMDHVQVSKTFGHLARCYKRLGDETKYHTLLENNLRVQERHYIRDNAEICVTLTLLGTSAGHRGNYIDAIAYLERALNIWEQHDNKGQITSVLRLIAHAQGKLGDIGKKKTLLQRALGIQVKHFGKHHVGVGNISASLGAVYGEMGDVGKKVKFLKQALATQKLFLGSCDAEVARTLTNLGNTFASLGKLDMAKEMLEEALEIKEQCFGTEHIEVAAPLASLGAVLASLGDFPSAKALLMHSLHLKQQHYGSNHLELSQTLLNLANVLGYLGDTSSRIQHLQRVVTIREAALGAEDILVGALLDELAHLLPTTAAREKRSLLLRVLAIYDDHYGKDRIDSLKLVPVLLAISASFNAEQDWGSKRRYLQEALSIQENTLDRLHADLVPTLAQLAWAMAATGEPELGRAVMRRGIEITKAADLSAAPPGLSEWIQAQFSALEQAMAPPPLSHQQEKMHTPTRSATFAPFHNAHAGYGTPAGAGFEGHSFNQGKLAAV